ncbi:MAG: hypothetical protein KatS3mg032_0774 [Cyclobacteriaceae bacterium]|nr:MAG: hypothetical protein KatS3mg032_0774 [Cyclobacteriaceae bacterium]
MHKHILQPQKVVVNVEKAFLQPQKLVINALIVE